MSDNPGNNGPPPDQPKPGGAGGSDAPPGRGGPPDAVVEPPTVPPDGSRTTELPPGETPAPNAGASGQTEVTAAAADHSTSASDAAGSRTDAPTQSPSDLARADQTGRYQPDQWRDTTLEKGTWVVQLDEGKGPSNFFTDLDSLEKSLGSYLTFNKETRTFEAGGVDAARLTQGIQVEKGTFDGQTWATDIYRGRVLVYQINENLNVAAGVAEANARYGSGGLTQYYIPGAKESIAKGETVIERRSDVTMSNRADAVGTFRENRDDVLGSKGPAKV